MLFLMKIKEKLKYKSTFNNDVKYNAVNTVNMS